MFVREKHYDNAIQKVKIQLGTKLGLESDEDAYVTFREPSEKEVLLLKVAKDDADRLDAFQKVFEESLVAHNFYETESIKMENKAVIELLFEKMDTTEKLIADYSNEVFRSRMRQEEEN